jgi:hypothetical protein
VKPVKYIPAILLLLLLSASSEISEGQIPSREDFQNPPVRFWPRPLWFWNNTTVTPEGVISLMQALRDKCGYGGFGIVPFGKNFSPEYLSEEYLKLYGIMLDKAKELGMTVSLYDEFGFPSGSVGAFSEGDDTPRFQLRYPEMTIQRLDKYEEDISGPLIYEKTIPEGKCMGVVAMELPGKRRIDITRNIINRNLKWKVPSGNWKIMIFTCKTDGEPIADYLEPEAAILFTGMVHDVYFRQFSSYFGNVISGTFFDEPSMFHAEFRMWTPSFNEKFEKKFGFSPISLYPALWYDIGPGTRSARNYLFGFRAELYSLGFTKVVGDWSYAHGITATGHSAPEEALVPANSSGDVIKSFRYLEIPGIDKIGGHRPAERFYKLISSSAYNWDRKLVMSETYGAMPDYNEPGDLSWKDIYQVAMDQYTKGINTMIPHAVWYDNTKVTYKPELSHRNPLYADSLKIFTKFLSRLNILLQKEGRHVADIAILYPIHTLLGEHYFYSASGPATIDGYVDPSNEFFRKFSAEIDYVNIANWLTNEAGKDFTFIHPEVLDEKCFVSGHCLNLLNINNPEEYKVIIIPSCAVMSTTNLRKVVDFYKQGGIVIFTTRLPSASAETGKDEEIADLVKSIFPFTDKETVFSTSNNNGGSAFFIPDPDGKKLRETLQKTGIQFDVSYPYNPSIQYIHKVIDGRNLYYFSNLGNASVEMQVTLRGKINLEVWDPHSGKSTKIKDKNFRGNEGDSYFTDINLNLNPFRSVFWIEE